MQKEGEYHRLFEDLQKTLGKYPVIKLTGELNLTLPEIIAVGKQKPKVSFKLSNRIRSRIKAINRQMLKQVKTGVPVYGTTTSFGGQAGRVLNKANINVRLDKATKLSKAIVHVDVSTGPAVSKEITRAAMLIRLNMLLSGYSAVRLKTLEPVRDLINHDITPIVGQYGGLGASGDLAQNGRVVATLLHDNSTKVWNRQNRVVNAKSALKKAGIGPIELEPKEGLALVNGDNFSTAAAVLIVFELASLMLVNTAAASLVIQALKGSIRDYHPMLSKLRPHPGQTLTAEFLRTLLKGSKIAYQEMVGHKKREDGIEVQDPYSIRCLPQFYGPAWERIVEAWRTIKINANSISDNPLWTTPEMTTRGEKPYQWVSGGNFLAMHMSETLDSLRKIAIQIVKQNDRHMARLVHPKLNKGLPPNLSDISAISQCTFKGLQTQMGMYEVYASLLASPVSTAFGVHEELNQDITSHAFTSAIMTWEVLKLTKYAVATSLISSCQAIDQRGGPNLLSPLTKPMYEWVRKSVPYIKKEQPLGHYVEGVASRLQDEQLVKRYLDVIRNAKK